MDIHKHQTKKIGVSSFSIAPVKRAHKGRTCWYRRPFRLIYRYQVKEKRREKKKKKKKTGLDRHNRKKEKKKIKLYKCIMANTRAIWEQVAHTTYQLSPPSCSTRAIQKSLWLYGVHRTRRDGSGFMSHQPCQHCK